MSSPTKSPARYPAEPPSNEQHETTNTSAPGRTTLGEASTPPDDSGSREHDGVVCGRKGGLELGTRKQYSMGGLASTSASDTSATRSSSGPVIAGSDSELASPPLNVTGKKSRESQSGSRQSEEQADGRRAAFTPSHRSPGLDQQVGHQEPLGQRADLGLNSTTPRQYGSAQQTDRQVMPTPVRQQAEPPAAEVASQVTDGHKDVAVRPRAPNLERKQWKTPGMEFGKTNRF